MGRAASQGWKTLYWRKCCCTVSKGGLGRLCQLRGALGSPLPAGDAVGARDAAPNSVSHSKSRVAPCSSSPRRDALPPELSSGSRDGQKETRPARVLLPARPHRHHQGSLAKGGRETHPDTSAQHWDMEREVERPFGGGSAPRITSKTPRATSLQGHSSTAGPTASKSSLREGAPAPAPFPGKPWPRAAGRGCRHRSPLPSRELSIPSCQPGPGASERGRRQV